MQASTSPLRSGKKSRASPTGAAVAAAATPRGRAKSPTVRNSVIKTTILRFEQK
jgi:hypothetical protein